MAMAHLLFLLMLLSPPSSNAFSLVHIIPTAQRSTTKTTIQSSKTLVRARCRPLRAYANDQEQSLLMQRSKEQHQEHEKDNVSNNNNNNNKNDDKDFDSLQNQQKQQQQEALQKSLQTALDEGNLRQAVTVLQEMDKDCIELTRAMWNRIFELIEERTANAAVEERKAMEIAATTGSLMVPAMSPARREMTDMYKTLRDKGQLSLFGAVDARLPLAAGSHQVPPALLEGILDLPLKALTPKATKTLLYAGMAMAIVQVLVSFMTGISLNALIVVSLLVVVMDRLVLNGAGFETLVQWLNPGVRQKIVRHEAGHFLVAYLLGCAVEGCVLDAWAALRDKRFTGGGVAGRATATSAGTSFFDAELSREMNTPRGSAVVVTRSSVDRYSMIVMAGIAAEAIQFGRADGGAGDEMSLIAFLSQLNNKIVRGGAAAADDDDDATTSTTTTIWDSDNIRNQARWGVLQAGLLLREYQPAHEALVEALERGGTLGECIFAMEQAARQHDLTRKQEQHPLGYIVEETLPEGRRVVWNKKKPTTATTTVEGDSSHSSSDSSAASMISLTSTNGNGNGNGSKKEEEVEVAAARADAVVAANDDDEDSMLAALKQYRSQVEAKLKDVEQKLKALE